MKTERINSLTGLRAAAMLTIFCSHLSYLAETSFRGFYSLTSNGRLGVNFFLVLSGFVLAIGYSNNLAENSIREDIHFVKKRISKIYIPYLITMIMAIPWYIIQATSSDGFLNVKLLLSRLILNTGMIQSAIPYIKYSASINEVSWFISTLFIIYIFTPSILSLNNKATKHYTLLSLICLIFAALVVNCCVYMVIREIEYVRFADCGLSIIYINPLIRIFPFLLGIIGYNIYCLVCDSRIRNGSFVEILSISGFFLWWILADKTGLPIVVTECLDMLISLLVILTFALSRGGIVSIMLSKEKALNLGNISLDFYLIHYLVINYGMIAAKHFSLDKGIAVVPLTIMLLAFSLCGAYLIHALSEQILLVLRKKKPALD